MRAITIVAIVAAAAAGIAAAYMLYAPAGIIAADTGDAQEGNQEPVPDNSADGGYKQVNVTVNGFELAADIASTGEQRSMGLAVKDNLNEAEGMLFVFSKPGEYEFWMKNMKFPIDIIWVDSDRQVVHIESSLEPCRPESCPTYKPDEDALYVLETVAGFAEKHDVIEGTVIEFDPAKL
ncbi:MAG: DUF192 domain-containing protein [Nitrososphaera sp.]